MAEPDDVEIVRKRLADAFRQIGADLEGLNRRAREATGTAGGIGKLDAVMGGLARAMLGTAGVAVGFHQVAKGLESVAAAGLKLQDLARDSGYAFESVKQLQGAYRLMGASTTEANRSIGNLGEKLQNLAVFKESSDLWQGLSKFPGKGAEIANSLMGISQAGMKSGDMMKATLEAVRMFNRQSDETKFAMAPLLGETVSSLEALERKLQIMKDLKLPTVDPNELERSYELWLSWQLKVQAVYDNVAAHAIIKLQEIYDKEGEHNSSIQGTIDAVKAFIDEGAGHVSALMRDINLVITGYEKLKSYMSGPLDKLDKFMGFPDGQPKSEGGMFPNGIQIPPALRQFFENTYGPGKRSEGTSGATDFSGRRRRDDDLVETEKESSKTLIEIRDTLFRMENPMQHGGSGDNTFNIGTGIRGGNAQASLGGFRPNRSQGGQSNTDDGVGAGLAGSDFVKARRERFAKEIAETPGMRERLAAMMQTEGNPLESLESLMNRMDYAGRTLNAGLTKDFYGPMRTGKYQSALAGLQNNPQAMARYNRIIDQALAGSNVIGGRTDQGMPSDPNGMYGYGTPVWMKRGGNVFTDWGGGPGRHAGAARYREMIERGVAGEIAAREKIDKAAQAPDKWSGGLNAKVEFLNVPDGVKTSADRVGDAFHELQISRTRQMGIYNQGTNGYE